MLSVIFSPGKSFPEFRIKVDHETSNIRDRQYRKLVYFPNTFSTFVETSRQKNRPVLNSISFINFKRRLPKKAMYLKSSGLLEQSPEKVMDEIVHLFLVRGKKWGSTSSEDLSTTEVKLAILMRAIQKKLDRFTYKRRLYSAA